VDSSYAASAANRGLTPAYRSLILHPLILT